VPHIPKGSLLIQLGKTNDVTPAILSRDTVAQLYRAIKLRDKIADVTSV